MRERSSQATRARAQAAALGLPAFPTTTIGSFPQTSEVRQARAAFNRGELEGAAYDAFLREETERAIRWQERVGLALLVHGERSETHPSAPQSLMRISEAVIRQKTTHT